ncbi:hypothetical protein [Galactobacter sp.]|uniref:hypothetical protein n=1 Tax=Galactobacter sp. TaxID=2676125 RepID=UPI0025C530FE|nr:hypothetical protein [Galactobacter sp.]
MTSSLKIECVGGLWDGRLLDIAVDEFGRLPAVLFDDGGKPYYSLLFDECRILAGNAHEYTGARYVPAAA